MIVVPFEPSHALAMDVQPAQRMSEFSPEALAAPAGDAWTGMVDGRPVACAGLVEVWAGRAYAWALLAAYAGPHMVSITRAIRCRLARSPYRRVEMAVDAGFSAGARWAELLGFERETPMPMRKYLPNGRDAWLYARTK